MVDNLQNTNSQPASQPGSLGGASAPVNGDTTSLPTSSAPAAEGTDPAKDSKDMSLDLSGLADTVANFTTKKSDGKKIDFSVTTNSPAKDKAMEDAIFEKTFFDRMTKTVVLAIVFLVFGLF